jgi:2-amino-4-hydroxy-6-hydroxymethyldihydropteridine diphosphokinase
MPIPPRDTHPDQPFQALIALGSNLSRPEHQVQTAIAELHALERSRLVGRSRLYRTAPVGPPGQPDYVNAVVSLDTHLSPLALLDAMQAIERAHGRVRDGIRWGPRVLDLDLLTYGDLIMDLPGLTIPHPEIARRAFVLVPMADVASGDFEIPGAGPLAGLLARCDRRGVEPIAERG